MAEIETHAVEGPEGFDACVARREGDMNWICFVRPDEDERWLSFAWILALKEPPRSFFFPREGMAGEYVKLVALLGMSWEIVAAKFEEVTAWQLRCLERLPAALWAQLETTSVEDLEHWRAGIENAAPGELLTAQLTGNSIDAVRN